MGKDNIKDSIKERLASHINNVEGKPSNSLIPLDENYIFSNMNLFNDLFSELEDSEIEMLKKESIKYFTIFSKNYTQIGEILSNVQVALKENKGAFLVWAEKVLGMKRQSVYNYINRYEFISSNKKYSNILESLPLTTILEIASLNNEELNNKIFNKELNNLKDIKEELKELKSISFEEKTTSIEVKEEPQIVEENFEEIIEITFSDIKEKINDVDSATKRKVEKLLKEIDSLLNK